VKISKLLSEAIIEPNLVAADKAAVLERLVDLAAACVKADCQADKPQVLAALQAREEVTSTGIGCGVAIPHAKIEGLSKMLLVFARSKTGVNFQALDDAPVYLIFMVIAPPGSVSDYLKLLAAISAFVKKEANRKALMDAAGKAEIIAAIKAGEGR
jgi:mannitol/fructose-specific phosphotransferase system IIA component (Ntr-type)